MYTRAGDRGETGLYGSKRVPKDSARVEAYGTVDELNCCVGLAASSCKDEGTSKRLRWVQRRLFVAGADLAAEIPPPGTADSVPRITEADTANMEKEIDALQERLPRLTNFILPGGSELSARLHHARSVCRRAERRVITLKAAEKTNPNMVPFLNRLSTYLFNLARYANMAEGVADDVWERG